MSRDRTVYDSGRPSVKYGGPRPKYYPPTPPSPVEDRYNSRPTGPRLRGQITVNERPRDPPRDDLFSLMNPERARAMQENEKSGRCPREARNPYNGFDSAVWQASVGTGSNRDPIDPSKRRTFGAKVEKVIDLTSGEDVRLVGQKRMSSEQVQFEETEDGRVIERTSPARGARDNWSKNEKGSSSWGDPARSRRSSPRAPRGMNEKGVLPLPCFREKGDSTVKSEKSFEKKV